MREKTIWGIKHIVHIIQKHITRIKNIYLYINFIQLLFIHDVDIRLLVDLEEYSPLFYALTWHNEAASDNDSYLPLDLVENFPPNTLLHLAAKGLKRDEVVRILRKTLALGIVNIFALRGGN